MFTFAKTTKSGLKKLETSLIRMLKIYFDTLNRVGVHYKCARQTDKRKDRTVFNNSALTLNSFQTKSSFELL